MSFFFPTNKSNNSVSNLFKDDKTRCITLSAVKHNFDGSKDKHTEVHYRNGSVMRWDSHKDK